MGLTTLTRNTDQRSYGGCHQRYTMAHLESLRSDGCHCMSLLACFRSRWALRRTHFATCVQAADYVVPDVGVLPALRHPGELLRHVS